MLITLKLNIKVKLNIKKLLYILTQENGKENVVYFIGLSMLFHIKSI